MLFYGDYHTHSRNSDGRQSAREIVEAARARGLSEIAITDHGPLAAVIGVKSAEQYLHMREEIEGLKVLYPDINIFLGAEANIRDLHGTLDIPDNILQQLDVVIAGLHPYTLPTSFQDGRDIFLQNSLRHLGSKQRQMAIDANTRAIVQAIARHPELDIISHPGLFFEVDIEEVAFACIKHQVLFEINCGHEHPKISDIMKAQRLGVTFIINSDSHFQSTVGDLQYGSSIVQKLDIDERLVVNRKGGGGWSHWAKKSSLCIF
ncbi:MAG: PHP domain-containing protein [Syntrophomonadaceae bacterium]|jgi:putative hydrolase